MINTDTEQIQDTIHSISLVCAIMVKQARVVFQRNDSTDFQMLHLGKKTAAPSSIPPPFISWFGDIIYYLVQLQHIQIFEQPSIIIYIYI